jgi:peptide/nickel transport system substrate-binding protein
MIIVLLALLLPIEAGAQGAKRDTLVVGMAQSLGDFHPFLTTALVVNYVLNASRRLMVAIDNKGAAFCRLCTEVPSVVNGRVSVVKQADGSETMDVTWTIRPDAKWADGVKLTAHDFVFGFEVGKAFAPSPAIAGAEAKDEATLVVHLRSVRYDFDRATAVPGPLPAHVEEPIFRAAKDPLDYGNKSAFNRAPETAGLWNGPYRVTKFVSGESVTVEPNEYWTGKKVGFKKIVFRLIENTAALQANQLSGDVDLTGEVALTLDQALGMEKSARGKLDITVLPTLGVQQLYVRQDVAPVSDKRVRQAIAMAIDRKTIVAKLFQGRVPVADSVLTEGEFGYDKGVKIWPYDPAAARKLLDEAGWKVGPDGIRMKDGARMSIDIAGATGNSLNDLLEQVLQSQLKAIGIELVINNVPTRVLIGDTLRYRKYRGMALLSYTPPPDWVPYARFHSSQIPTEANNWIGSDTFGINNPTLDAALVAANAALDPVERKKQWKIILGVLAEELPVIPLFVLTSPIVAPTWLAGVVPAPLPGLSTGWIEDWRVK